mmetsp:Transcript_61269/g.138660  ORF Transcript_61269/g.138660 Transcript_61269/m.138660 type:complete len:254 (+) Transcript_61269:884-1645(+)
MRSSTRGGIAPCTNSMSPPAAAASWPLGAPTPALIWARIASALARAASLRPGSSPSSPSSSAGIAAPASTASPPPPPARSPPPPGALLEPSPDTTSRPGIKSSLASRRFCCRSRRSRFFLRCCLRSSLSLSGIATLAPAASFSPPLSSSPESSPLSSSAASWKMGSLNQRFMAALGGSASGATLTKSGLPSGLGLLANLALAPPLGAAELPPPPPSSFLRFWFASALMAAISSSSSSSLPSLSSPLSPLSIAA